MSKPRSPKPWPVDDVTFVEVEIHHSRERQMHIHFENGTRLIIGDSSQIPLAAELISYLRTMQEVSKGDQA